MTFSEYKLGGITVIEQRNTSYHFLREDYFKIRQLFSLIFLQTLSFEEQKFQAQPLLDCSQLRHFAKEAQLNEDYQLAAQYYQEVHLICSKILATVVWFFCDRPKSKLFFL